VYIPVCVTGIGMWIRNTNITCYRMSPRPLCFL